MNGEVHLTREQVTALDKLLKRLPVIEHLSLSTVEGGVKIVATAWDGKTATATLSPQGRPVAV